MYIFFWFFKQLYYIFKKLTKHKFILLFMFFILTILLFSSKIFAFDYNGNPVESNSTEFISAMKNLPEYQSGEWYYVTRRVTDEFQLLFFKKADTSNVHVYIGNMPDRIYIKSDTPFECQWYRFNTSNNTFTPTHNGISPGFEELYNNPVRNVYYFNSNIVVYTSSSYTDIFYAGDPVEPVNPFIVNDNNTIVNWSFNELIINCGSINPNSRFWLDCNYEGYTFDIDVSDYVSISNNIAFINIPKSILNSSIVLRNGFQFGFNLEARTPNLQVLYFELGSYTLSLTDQEQNIINEDSNKQVLSDISNNQKETTHAIENLDSTIKDGSVDDSSISLPADNSNDITQEGINGIFTSIYNAFCTGEAQDIVFPIPFTNKNITLQANYVRQMLTNSGAGWVITIIEAFWWYLISRYIIKDITNKITKIKSGNIEDIENSNIKGDML